METRINTSSLGSFSTQLHTSSFHPEPSSQQVDTGSQTHVSDNTSLSLTSPPSSPEAACLGLSARTPDRDVSPLSLPLAAMLVNQPGSPPTVTNGTVPSTIYPSIVEHTNFKQIIIHTARCDKCNDHNKATLNRCTTCGFQICTPCWLHRGGGNHAATRTFRGPVFDPNAGDEESDVNDEAGGLENRDVSMSDIGDDVGDQESDAMIVYEDEQAITIDDSEDAFSDHSMDENGDPPPPPPPPPPGSISGSQKGKAFQPMFIDSSDSENSSSEDGDSVKEPRAYQIIRRRTIARRYNHELSLNRAAKVTREDDDSVIEMSSPPARGHGNGHNGPYYSDLAPECRERIDILIGTAINLFQDATLDRQSANLPTSNINKTNPHIDSPLFVPIAPNDDLTPSRNERLTHLTRLAQTCTGPRAIRKSQLSMPQGDGIGRRGQMTYQSLTPPPTVTSGKRKRATDDVQGREGVWKGPFLDESTDEEC
ncbi:hypothetical protein ACJ72_04621 [Emergomyces africanus]|uniref:Uncharacterized protein n=1 Tax=Emergomyces africanus TaxID=1955775 RepID=A0A1B7NWC0_9EURO|nr:hypothetical protein ACJ72_04621 [Emergomyces africanus]